MCCTRHSCKAACTVVSSQIYGNCVNYCLVVSDGCMKSKGIRYLKLEPKVPQVLTIDFTQLSTDCQRRLTADRVWMQPSFILCAHLLAIRIHCKSLQYKWHILTGRMCLAESKQYTALSSCSDVCHCCTSSS